MMPVTTPQEAKTFSASMIDSQIDLSISQGEAGGKIFVDISIETETQKLRFYAEAFKESYSDACSKLAPFSKEGFILNSFIASEFGIVIKVEDIRTGNIKAFRVILDKKTQITRIITYELTLKHPPKLKLVA